MSDPNTPSITDSSSGPQQQKISLTDISKRYLTGLQRIFDLTSYLVEGVRQVSERTYDDFSNSVRFQPVQKERMAFDEAKETTERWLLRCLLAEALSLTVPLLEDLRSVCALAQWQGQGGKDEQGVRRILSDDRKAFLALDNAEKFKHLQSHFEVGSPLSPFVLAYMKAHGCLGQQRGVVSEKDLTTAGSLLMGFVSLTVSADSTAPKVGEYQRSFSIGETIHLEKTDYLNILTTLTIFSNSLMKSVQEWVKKQGIVS